MVDRDRYDAVVRVFSDLTRQKWPNDRCCERTRDGAPECCFQIADGAELTFTEIEFGLLPEIPMVPRPDDDMLVIDRQVWSAERIADELNGGLLAATLECASHPTRPLLGDSGLLLGVAVIDGCNRDVSDYGAIRDDLHSLWSVALEVGVKPYYAQQGRVKPSWRIL